MNGWQSKKIEERNCLKKKMTHVQELITSYVCADTLMRQSRVRQYAAMLDYLTELDLQINSWEKS